MLYKTNHEFLAHIKDLTVVSDDLSGTQFTCDAIQITIPLKDKDHPTAVETTINIPCNFGDSISKVPADFAKVRNWIQDMITYGSAPTLRGTTKGAVISLLMGLNSNNEMMENFFRVKNIMDLKEDAKDDRAIFCEYLALKNIHEGNIDAAKVFFNQMKEALVDMMEAMGLGDQGNKIVTTSINPDGSEESKEEVIGSGQYLKIMNYMRDKNRYCDYMLKKFDSGFFNGTHGLCYYDRQHYMHSALLIFYNKMIDGVMTGVGEVGWEGAGLAKIKAQWEEEHKDETDAHSWNQAFQGITASGIEDLLYENLDAYLTRDNCNHPEDMIKEVRDERLWDNYLPFGSNFYKEQKGMFSLVNQSFETQAKFRSQVGKEINSIKRTLMWDVYDKMNAEDVEVMRIQ